MTTIVPDLMATDIDEEIIDPRITRDLRAALANINRDSARFLVDAYYQAQGRRIELRNQERASEQGRDEAMDNVLGWIADRETFVERQIAAVLKSWAEGHQASEWAMSICGIGPVLAAGLRAHIDITQAPTVGHIWRFAGLDPTLKWEKRTKRPWNAQLKVLCWKIGESFVKVSGRPQDIYGQVYRERKELEAGRNERLEYAEQAANTLATKSIKAEGALAFYAAGKLPPGHIHARAKRYAVKLFLSHYHHVAYEVEYGVPPPKPYILSAAPEIRGNHSHFLAPPRWPISPGE